MNEPKARAIPEVLAERVRYYREQAGLGQADVSKITEELGHPLNRVSLARLEAGGTRAANASVADVLVLALALNVPPAHLFLPIGQDAEIEITPRVSLSPHVARDWLVDSETFDPDGPPVRDPERWRQNTRDRLWFDQFTEMEGMAVLSPTDENITRLGDHLRYMRQAGLVVPRMVDHVRERLAELGYETEDS